MMDSVHARGVWPDQPDCEFIIGTLGARDTGFCLQPAGTGKDWQELSRDGVE